MKKLPSCLRWVCGGLIVIGVISIVVVYWEWFSDGESGSTTLRNLGLMVAGVIALWFAYRRSGVADRQAETSHRGLLNERYQKGAEMLGSKVLSVRLGGIYALQRLAKDDPKQYHVQITHLLCTFVSHPTEDDDYMAALRVIQQKPHQLREDVQAAITAIGTRNEEKNELEKKEKFSLTLVGAYLADAYLSGANLTGVKLLQSDLTIATLINTNLLNADLTTANLTGADLTGANLTGATLLIADLTTAVLNNANLTRAILTNAILTKASLTGADLTNATLINANLTRAVLSGANLSGAYLMGANDLTQRQLDQACADPDNPPKLGGACDAETDLPLEWRGQPFRK